MKINLKTPADVTKKANEIKYFCTKEQKNGIFICITERIKALLLKIRL